LLIHRVYAQLPTYDAGTVAQCGFNIRMGKRRSGGRWWNALRFFDLLYLFGFIRE